MPKKAFFKVFLSDDVRTITKRIDDSKTISELKREVLKRVDVPRPRDKEKDFILLAPRKQINLAGDANCSVLSNGDVLIMFNKDQPESFLFSSDYKNNVGSSLFDLKRVRQRTQTRETLYLDGESLDYATLVGIGEGRYNVQLSSDAIRKIKDSREVVDFIIAEDMTVYGITTGFGRFENIKIPPEKTAELQVNLIRSHSCGVGQPFSQMRTRMIMALRVNVLAKGFSGIRVETLQKVLQALNADCLPYVPEKGSVGASGDLAPLSHLVLGLMGEGQMWSPLTGWGDADEILELYGFDKLVLEAKEGLALNNGTQVITALGAEVLYRAELLAKQADVIAAFTTDILEGVPDHFSKDIHDTRAHAGQSLSAARMRHLVHVQYEDDPDAGKYPSVIVEKRLQREAQDPTTKKNQDPYSIRCTPQVHGIVHQTIEYAKGIINTEINSATDNPLVYKREDGEKMVRCGGNFHGEYPGMVLDQLAIAVQELSNVSEWRIERLVHPNYLSRIAGVGLPAFLVGAEEGLNSGFMITQYTAAALVSENKVLTHPSTVDSITTSGGSEDHVSMGTYAARKALTIIENVENVLAIELYTACQALDLHRAVAADSKTTDPLEAIFSLVRQYVKKVEIDRFMAPDIIQIVRLVQEGQIWEVAKNYLPPEYT